LLDDDLRAALDRAEGGFVNSRKIVVDGLENFDEFREYGKQVKDHTLANLDYYLELFEQRVQENGGHVHWARNGEEANRIILDICKNTGARKITKGKSMVSEEASTNASLESHGYQVVETDLGEYIIQLAQETPSHIIAPAVHKSKQAVTDLFYEHHKQHGYDRVTGHEEIVDQARKILRGHFCSADVGITGGNFLVAETGSVAIVTNEGNGDLTSSLPRVHIVTTSIEKVIPDLQSLGGFLRILGRSATGQIMSVYTTLFNGPRRQDDIDGPEEFHVILLDNGRSNVLGGDYQDILRCIRCGACLNHCPVYTNIGGHAYGWVYPGPMGSVLTPLLVGRENAGDLPNACTLNGRCKTVCPVKIPLPELLRKHRSDLVKMAQSGWRQKLGIGTWYWLARYPAVYSFATGIMAATLSCLDRLGQKSTRGFFRYIPLAGAWTTSREFPAPGGSPFQAQWKKTRNARK
jgi:L-lactate dehydrogenase complex protein LldF